MAFQLSAELDGGTQSRHDTASTSPASQGRRCIQRRQRGVTKLSEGVMAPRSRHDQISRPTGREPWTSCAYIPVCVSVCVCRADRTADDSAQSAPRRPVVSRQKRGIPPRNGPRVASTPLPLPRRLLPPLQSKFCSHAAPLIATCVLVCLFSAVQITRPSRPTWFHSARPQLLRLLSFPTGHSAVNSDTRPLPLILTSLVSSFLLHHI